MFFKFLFFPEAYIIQHKRKIIQRISKFSKFFFYALNKRFHYMRKKLELLPANTSITIFNTHFVTRFENKKWKAHSGIFRKS